MTPLPSGSPPHAPDAAPASPPLARVDDAPTFSAVWLVPILAAAVAGILGWQAWGARGVPITIHLGQAHGLKAGHVLRYRGMVAGEVTAVSMTPQLDGVTVRVALERNAAGLARVGSRFWVVRPRLGFEGVAGLDTLIGDRYLAVLPGTGAPHDEFVGLDEPPIADALEPGLDIVLEGSGRGGLVTGAPVTYRRIQVGTILGTSLASDARTVEVAVRIRGPYAALVRGDTRFWVTEGAELDVGLTGISLRVDSMLALLQGGVALATPEGAAGRVRTGHRFELADKPQAEWLRWRPAVAIGHSLLPPGMPLAQPARAALSWTEGRFWSGTERVEGWVLPLAGGLLGPIELFQPEESAHEGSAQLEVGGSSHVLDTAPELVAAGLGLLPLAALPDLPAWPRNRQRVPDEPEDCLLVAGPGTPPFSLSAGRFSAEDGAWNVDAAISLDARWHGAPVLARSDGKLIGMLLLDDDDLARVVPLPRPLP